MGRNFPPILPTIITLPASEITMSLPPALRRCLLALVFLCLFCLTQGLHASTITASPLPILWGKSWAIGYALLFLGILLGMLAVLIPSMRKVLRKKDT